MKRSTIPGSSCHFSFALVFHVFCDGGQSALGLSPESKVPKISHFERWSLVIQPTLLVILSFYSSVYCCNTPCYASVLTENRPISEKSRRKFQSRTGESPARYQYCPLPNLA